MTRHGRHDATYSAISRIIVPGVAQRAFRLAVYWYALPAPLGRHTTTGAVLSPLSTAADSFQADGDPWRYLLPFLVVAPTLETLIECGLPYWVMRRWLKVPTHSPWPFVSVSALVMVVLHPLTPVVIVMAFITGSFLAYVYAHFAPSSHAKAFLHTAVFHAGINLVGWTMLMAAQ